MYLALYVLIGDTVNREIDVFSTHDPHSVVFDSLVVVCIITAEKFLESVEGKEEYNVLLLKIVDDASADGLIRFAAAIAFKNSVKRNWRIVSSIKIAECDNN